MWRNSRFHIVMPTQVGIHVFFCAGSKDVMAGLRRLTR
jgi:hypothetical protein